MKKGFLNKMLALILCSAVLLSMGSISSFAAKKKAKLSIKLNKKTLNLNEGTKSYKLKATVKPAKAKVKWKSSDKKIATVSSKGKIKVKKSGKVTITATASYKGKKKSAKCVVNIGGSAKKSPSPSAGAPASAKPSAGADPSPVPSPEASQGPVKVEEIVTDKDEYTIMMGEDVTPEVKVLPENATDKSIKYNSNKKTVATVSSANGKVTPVKEGTANIIITSRADAKVKKTIKITVVSAPIPTPEPEEGTILMSVGDKREIEAANLPAGAAADTCTIKSSKDYIASVGDDKKIEAKYPGITVMDVTSATGAKSQFRVRVIDNYLPKKVEGFDEENDAVLHGLVGEINYNSDYREGNKGHALAWFPPNYNKNENKKYNLLFCLHGGNDNEYYWTANSSGANGGCRANHVLDNAYAEGVIEDTIVVFTSGVIPYDEAKKYPNVVANPQLTDFWKNHFLLEFEIVNNLLPYMRTNYPIMEGPEHTAICGLSMGCAQTMEIGFKHPDLFDYVGCYSAGPFEGADGQTFVTSKEDAAKLNDQLKLVFFITGQNDHMMDDSMRNFIKICNKYGLNNTFYEVTGRGHDDYCWDKALYAFMKYAFK